MKDALNFPWLSVLRTKSQEKHDREIPLFGLARQAESGSLTQYLYRYIFSHCYNCLMTATFSERAEELV